MPDAIGPARRAGHLGQPSSVVHFYFDRDSKLEHDRFRLSQKEANRVGQRVDQGVDLGAQSAARAANRLVLAGFFLAPALCWWARTMVLSIIAYSLSASAARC